MVDDDPILREVMSGQLASLGWDVVDGRERRSRTQALWQRVRSRSCGDRHQHAGTRWLWPAPAVAAESRARIDLPVIVCTSHNDREAIDRAYQLGASSFRLQADQLAAIPASRAVRHAQRRHRTRLARRQGRRAIASRTKSAMFQVLSHELKTPLTALIGLTTVIDSALQGRWRRCGERTSRTCR